MVATLINYVPEIRELIEPSGLLDFLAIKASKEGYIALLKALAERWWDTTNTFHFPCGEMTVTPTDITMITGLHFGTRALEFFDDWRNLPPGTVRDLLGAEPPRDSLYIPRSWIRSRVDELSSVAGLIENPEHVARTAILMILGCSFVHTMRDTVNLNVLRSLLDLSILEQYDWAGATLSVMYREMGDMSRGIFSSLGGTSFIWEVCMKVIFYLFSLFL